jgi:hypothetical protein
MKKVCNVFFNMISPLKTFCGLFRKVRFQMTVFLFLTKTQVLYYNEAQSYKHRNQVAHGCIHP